MKHTPGPWEIDATEDTLFIRATAKLDAVVAQVELNSEIVTTADEVEPGQQRRNARLISAAPELLDSAQGLLSVVAQLRAKFGVKCLTPAQEAIWNTAVLNIKKSLGGDK